MSSAGRRPGRPVRDEDDLLHVVRRVRIQQRLEREAARVEVGNRAEPIERQAVPLELGRVRLQEHAEHAIRAAQEVAHGLQTEGRRGRRAGVEDEVPGECPIAAIGLGCVARLLHQRGPFVRPAPAAVTQERPCTWQSPGIRTPPPREREGGRGVRSSASGPDAKRRPPPRASPRGRAPPPPGWESTDRSIPREGGGRRTGVPRRRRRAGRTRPRRPSGDPVAPSPERRRVASRRRAAPRAAGVPAGRSAAACRRKACRRPAAPMPTRRGGAPRLRPAARATPGRAPAPTAPRTASTAAGRRPRSAGSTRAAGGRCSAAWRSARGSPR